MFFVRYGRRYAVQQLDILQLCHFEEAQLDKIGATILGQIKLSGVVPRIVLSSRVGGDDAMIEDLALELSPIGICKEADSADKLRETQPQVFDCSNAYPFSRKGLTESTRYIRTVQAAGLLPTPLASRIETYSCSMISE